MMALPGLHLNVNLYLERTLKSVFRTSFHTRKYDKQLLHVGKIHTMPCLTSQKGPLPLTLASLGFQANVETDERVKTKKTPTKKKKSSIDDKLLQSIDKLPVPRKEVIKYNVDPESAHPSEENTEKMPRNDRPVKPNKNYYKEPVFTKDCFPFAAKTFCAFNLSEMLLQRLGTEGFDVPTDVQAHAIPTILEGHDVAIQSYTGSGKTLAYLLPILSKVGPLKADKDGGCSKSGIEVVIVAPSRELAMQIVREAERFLGPGNKRAVQQLVGGANRSRQEEALKKNKPLIVVGTPGRISEISLAGKLHTHHCRFLVLDEVDELLSFNFREDLHRILEHVGQRRSSQNHNARNVNLHMESTSPTKDTKRVERQTILVSATMTPAVLRAADSWSCNPLLVRANDVVDLRSPKATEDIGSKMQAAKESLPPSLDHYYCIAQQQHKVDMLRKCIHALDAKSVIVFMNHNKQLKDTVFKLDARGIEAVSLHGDLSKLERANRLSSFRKGALRVLVTNELAARGLDVINCDLVINLDLPTDSVHYTHRAGRTGRLGQKGTVVSICEHREEFVLNKFQHHLDVPILLCDFAGGKLTVHDRVPLSHSL